MKFLRLFIILTVVLSLLVSCSDTVNNETEQDAEDIGSFGDGYRFDYHYAQTPDSIYYIKGGVIKVNKSDFNEKTTIASTTVLGTENADKLSADIVGVTSNWLYVSVNRSYDTKNNTPIDDVYKISPHGKAFLLIKGVTSAYFHNGVMYYTKTEKNGDVKLHRADLATNQDTIAEIKDPKTVGFTWYKLKDGKIANGNLVVDKNNNVEIRGIKEDERLTETTGRDAAKEQFVTSLLDSDKTLISYAEAYGSIYYLSRDKNTKTVSFNRADVTGENKTVLEENSNLSSLFAYEDTLYGDINEDDAGRLVKLNENLAITKTDAVTGVGQWGSVKIEDGLFIRTYMGTPHPALVYIYNPTNGQVLISW